MCRLKIHSEIILHTFKTPRMYHARAGLQSSRVFALTETQRKTKTQMYPKRMLHVSLYKSGLLIYGILAVNVLSVTRLLGHLGRWNTKEQYFSKTRE